MKILPCQLTLNWLPLQLSHTSPATNSLHCVHTFLFAMVYFFCSFGCSFAHSARPSPSCRMVRPIFGFVMSLYDIATIRALHLSLTRREWPVSLPLIVLSFENET